VQDTGRLALDISSYCVNCKLDEGRGVNRFINTIGGAKIDGGVNTVDCILDGFYYDGQVNGQGSVNGYAFRAIGKRAKVKNVEAINCGGSGINSLTNGSIDDDLQIKWENVRIVGVTNGDGSSSTFNGKPIMLKHDSAGDLDLEIVNVEVHNAAAVGQLDANNVRGSLKLVNNSLFTFNNNTAGKTKNIHLELGLVDSIYNVVNDGTNGGSEDVQFFLKEFDGNSELDIEYSSDVVVSGSGPIRSTRTRQIRFDNCTDFHISDLTGNGTSMVWIAGTMSRGIAHGLTGDYSDGLIFESGGTTYTANKGLYADCINSGAGGYVISSTAVQDNLL